MPSPVLTSKNLPQTPPLGAPVAPKGAPIFAHELEEGVIAKPLGSPDFLGLQPKNPLHILRWVNYDVGNGHSTRRYDECKAMGFVNATKDSVQLADGKPCPDGLVRDGGARIVYGDVVAMLLDKATYYGALKYNHNKAVRRVERLTTTQRGKEHMKQALSEVSAPPEVRSKISVFTPDQKELSNLDRLEGDMDVDLSKGKD